MHELEHVLSRPLDNGQSQNSLLPSRYLTWPGVAPLAHQLSGKYGSKASLHSDWAALQNLASRRCWHGGEGRTAFWTVPSPKLPSSLTMLILANHSPFDSSRRLTSHTFATCYHTAQGRLAIHDLLDLKVAALACILVAHAYPSAAQWLSQDFGFSGGLSAWPAAQVGVLPYQHEGRQFHG